MIEHSGIAGSRFICNGCGETKEPGTEYFRKGNIIHCSTCGKP